MALSSRSADPVDSVEDLRTAIESAKQRMEEEQARERTLTAEVEQANERQRLRRELDKHSKALLDQRRKNAMHEQKRRWVDTDQFGPHLPEGLPIRPKSTKSQHQESCGESIDFGNLVSSFEYVWRLEHLSWLRAWLRQEDMDGVWSQVFRVADGEFDFGYNPDGGTAEDEQNGTLVIRCWGSRIAFRYRIFVKARCGKFVQWGETRDEFQEWKEEYESWEYGPDVHEPGSRPSSLTSMGIFGLSHQQLLRSDWVDNDTLTVKFMLEVRPQGDAYSASSYTQLLKTTVNVPGPTMGSDMLRFLEKSAGSDVEFVVQGERIKAHSQVLCARSEVFEKQLTTGMKESVSKMITIEDCDPASFKTLLHYLYTDDLGCIDELLSKAHGDGGSFSGTQLQALLAVSH
ncbi:BPM1, partial [Symbiodinium sp. CCMP2456]